MGRGRGPELPFCHFLRLGLRRHGRRFIATLHASPTVDSDWNVPNTAVAFPPIGAAAPPHDLPRLVDRNVNLAVRREAPVGFPNQ